MKRRQIIAGLGSLAAGTSLTVGNGAFGSTEARRNISVAVENDRDAYISLVPTSSDFSTMTNQSTLRFVFDGDVSPPSGTNQDTGDGVAPDSVYEFPDLFKVENQSPDDIVIFGQGSDEQNITIEIITDGVKQPLTPQNPSEKILSPGGDQVFGLRLTTGDIIPNQTVQTDVSITAATENSEKFSDVISE